MEYKHNCRCCLNSFEVEDTQIRITPIVQRRFEELTSVEVLISNRNCYCLKSKLFYIVATDARFPISIHLREM